MVISFSVKEARNHLLKEGFVYTFRWKERKNIGKNWANKGRLKGKIANVYIHKPRLIETVSDLNIYVSGSGFKTKKEWFDVIMSMNIPKSMHGFIGYLYKVSVLSKKYCCFNEEVKDECNHPAMPKHCFPLQCKFYWDKRWPYGRGLELWHGKTAIKSQQLRTNDNPEETVK